MRGVISHGVTNLMQFIYRLHWGLALDKTGIWILGIAALLWTIDCFTSFYLTLPSRARRGGHGVAAPRGPARSFWARWKPAWLVKTNASTYRLNFDLHRAGGLWLWGVLLVFAWSSVYMNLWDTVHPHHAPGIHVSRTLDRTALAGKAPVISPASAGARPTGSASG
jgi:uncharacterized iron-regulated membrane protein